MPYYVDGEKRCPRVTYKPPIFKPTHYNNYTDIYNTNNDLIMQMIVNKNYGGISVLLNLEEEYDDLNILRLIFQYCIDLNDMNMLKCFIDNDIFKEHWKLMDKVIDKKAYDMFKIIMDSVSFDKEHLRWFGMSIVMYHSNVKFFDFSC